MLHSVINNADTIENMQRSDRVLLRLEEDRSLSAMEAAV